LRLARCCQPAAHGRAQTPSKERRSTHGHDPPPPDDHLDARAVIAGLTDFGPGRSKLFGNSADDYLKVHNEGANQADVTEGSSGIWERLHYDWSDPNHVVLTTTDSNVWGGNSGHTYTFTQTPDGTTDGDVVVVREGKSIGGPAVGPGRPTSCITGASPAHHLATLRGSEMWLRPAWLEGIRVRAYACAKNPAYRSATGKPRTCGAFPFSQASRASPRHHEHGIALAPCSFRDGWSDGDTSVSAPDQIAVTSRA
jgi:hypothetical protein